MGHIPESRKIKEERIQFLEKKLGIKAKIPGEPDYWELLKADYCCTDTELMRKHKDELMTVINKITKNSRFVQRHWDWLKTLKEEISIAFTTLSDSGKLAEYIRHMKKDVWGPKVYENLLLVCQSKNDTIDDSIRKLFYVEGLKYNLERADVDEIIGKAIQEGVIREGIGTSENSHSLVIDEVKHPQLLRRNISSRLKTQYR